MGRTQGIGQCLDRDQGTDCGIVERGAGHVAGGERQGGAVGEGRGRQESGEGGGGWP